MKINERTKLSDLATVLKLSTSTVSRALNDHPRIPLETKQRVKKLAKEMSYHPNPFAKGLYTKETKTIGIILPSFEYHFFTNLLGLIEKDLFQKGYKVICTRTGNSKEEEINACWGLAKAHVDGIIAILSYDYDDQDSFLIDINEEGIPIVFLDRTFEHIDASFVTSDDFQGAYDATEYLIQQGKQSILHLAGPKSLSTSFYRKMGFQEAFKEYNQPVGRIVHCDEEKEVVSMMSPLIHTIDAIFCFNDYYAFQVLELAHQKGIKVPSELSIIGYANEPVSRYTTPKLSTVDQSVESMSKETVKILLNEVKSSKKKKIIDYKMYKSKTNLVIRES